MTSELWRLPAHTLTELLGRRDVTAVDIVGSYLNRLEEREPRVASFLYVDGEGAMARARAIDSEMAGPLPPLAGVPMALKDNICAAGLPTTAGSKILRGFVPPYDATVVSRLHAAGAVLLGKANCDEFAMGSSTENSAYHPTRNPWDTSRVPGGSSGGSAAAIAAGQACFALGSDTGGSVRQPAALCGVVGLKPTYGRVSRYGLIAFASSLDQIGPLTRDVTDCALVLNAIAGHDPLDSTAADVATPDFTASLVPEVKGLRIGVPREYFGAGTEPGVDRSVREAISLLERLGAHVDECSLPHTAAALDVYYVLAPAEASANLARYDGVRYGPRAEGARTITEMYAGTRAEGFGPEVRRRIIIGTYVLSAGYYDAYYVRAQKVRTLVCRDFTRAFERFDLLVTPTSPTVAFPMGARTLDPLAMYLSDACTIPANLAGLPAISVPCGPCDGLPVGLQFIGRALDEGTLLRAAYTYEQYSGNGGVLP
jgi:aspartyl-tRNA(Asn)/glutamyl-tRNA(Gln) amidotransferase subunit A